MTILYLLYDLIGREFSLNFIMYYLLNQSNISEIRSKKIDIVLAGITHSQTSLAKCMSSYLVIGKKKAKKEVEGAQTWILIFDYLNKK